HYLRTLLCWLELNLLANKNDSPVAVLCALACVTSLPFALIYLYSVLIVCQCRYISVVFVNINNLVSPNLCRSCSSASNASGDNIFHTIDENRVYYTAFNDFGARNFLAHFVKLGFLYFHVLTKLVDLTFPVLD